VGVLLWTCAETGSGRVRGFINAASDARGRGVVPVRRHYVDTRKAPFRHACRERERPSCTLVNGTYTLSLRQSVA
jgi:hypothetical protein